MKFLIRSTFVGSPTDDKELSFRNFLLLDDSGLGFDVPEDVTLWEFIRDFTRTHNHSPDVRTIRSHFEALRKPEPIDRLEVVSPFKPLYRGDFIKRLEERAEDRRVRLVTDLLREAGQIVQTGIEFKEGKETKLFRGPVDAIRFLIHKSHDIVTPTSSARLSGEVLGDTKDFRQEFDRIKADPLAGMGQFTGIEQFDVALKGAKRGELWTHAAFTGGLKSTLMLNWAYNQAVYMGYDVCIFSLEMPYHQCRRILIAMHGMHGKFKGIRAELGLPLVGIEYDRLRDGELSPAEETFMLNYVLPDLDSGNYGKIHIEVSDPDKSDFTVIDLKSKAELIYSRSPFKLLFVDHAGLMAPRKWVPSTTERVNEVIRDLKRLAMNFNRGAGIAVVDLFQISREGFKAAEKITEKQQGSWANGPYNLTHLSYANECLVGSTLVTTSTGLKPLHRMEVGDQVWSLSGWKDVSAVFDQGVRPTWRLTLDGNNILEGTGNHRIRVVRDEKLIWGELSSLQVGDFVVSTKASYPWASEAVHLPEMSFASYEHQISRTGARVRTPSVSNYTDLAYLLGAWDGDGNNGRMGLCFTGNRTEVEVKTRIQSAFLVCFGVTIQNVVSQSRPGSFDLQSDRTPIKRWFTEISGPRGQKVPDFIMQSTKGMVCSYLLGVFDTDGSINVNGVVNLASKHECFLREIQMLLSMLGINSFLGQKTTTLKKTGKSYLDWFLNIRGHDSLLNFSRHIGFTDIKKSDRLNKKIASPSSRKRSDERLPFARMAVDLVYEHLPYNRARHSLRNKLTTYVQEGSIPSSTVSYILTKLNELGVKDPRKDFLHEVVSVWKTHRVVSCVLTGMSEPVYDIEVGGDHEYQTGPILSHNCERSSDIVTASYVNDDLRARCRVLFQCLKTRDVAPFANFFGEVKWGCRRIQNCPEILLSQERTSRDAAWKDDTLDEITEVLGR